MEQADRLMKEYGVDIDTASEEWVEFAEKMRIATSARPNFEKLKETLQNISGILKDLNFGDIISEEDYQELIAYNDEWERFFMMQADGTRKFIGDSAVMRQETMDNIRA